MDDKTLVCDVFIVGGGPAGLSVAATLPDNVSCVIVHQDREIGLPVRTSGASWLQDAERLGIPEHLFKRIGTSEVFSDKEQAVIAMGDEVPVILDTPRLYQWLARQSDHKDRSLLLATKFVSITRRDDGRYESRIRGRNTHWERVIATYVIDASGWHFAVLEALGLASKPERLAVGTEYEYPIGQNDTNRVIAFFGTKAPAGYGWAFPTAQDTLRIGVGIIQPDTDKSPRDLLDAVIADGRFLKRMGLTLEGTPIVHSGILPSVAYDDRLVFGNVIRVGDSANFATPTLGEGIRVCIEFGRLLGTRLGEAVRTGRPAPLKAYERACRRKLKRDYHWGFIVNQRAAKYTPEHWNAAVRRMGMVGPDAIIATFRGEFPPAKIARMVLTFSRLYLRARWRWIRSRLRAG